LRRPRVKTEWQVRMAQAHAARSPDPGIGVVRNRQ
jgi:hypothetical protein